MNEVSTTCVSYVGYQKNINDYRYKKQTNYLEIEIEKLWQEWKKWQ